MITCICIDDQDHPETIHTSKWVKKDEKYHITYTCTVLPQRILAVSLFEKPFGPDYAPFEYFTARCFAFKVKELPVWMDLIALCSEEGNGNVIELMKELTVVEQD